MPLPIPALARAAERLRFRAAWHQGADDARLAALRAELLERNPWHPIALNFRARAALPETFLPPPEPELAPLGVAFLRDDLDEVRRLATASKTPRARLALAQVALSRGEVVDLDCDDTVDVLVVRAAMKRAVGDLPGSLALAAEALTANPLYGTARVLLAEVNEAQGSTLIRLPLMAPVERTNGRLVHTRNLSDGARAAWTAWNRAVSSPGNGELPPGSAGHRALLEAWRARPQTAPRFREDPNLEIARLDRWEREGLLAAYEWSCGLTRANSEAFRRWAVEGSSSLRRLWREGLRA
ncbi:MAG TPA: hypothetical protein QGF58_13765 [Myxococcota bacterium]|nr:hypothetical protein [Myxococcota bacterium]